MKSGRRKEVRLFNKTCSICGKAFQAHSFNQKICDQCIFDTTTPDARWSIGYLRCKSCGTTKRKHVANGYCTKCYTQLAKKEKGHRKKWSRYYDCCINCGTTEKKHLAQGLCVTCYRKRDELRCRGTKAARGSSSQKMTKTFLIKNYHRLKKSMVDIAKQCNCSRQYVYKMLKKYNIPTRGRETARRIALERGKVSYLYGDSAQLLRTVIHHRIKYNKKFFSFWTDKMAYVLV